MRTTFGGGGTNGIPFQESGYTFSLNSMDGNIYYHTVSFDARNKTQFNSTAQVISGSGITEWILLGFNNLDTPNMTLIKKSDNVSSFSSDITNYDYLYFMFNCGSINLNIASTLS